MAKFPLNSQYPPWGGALQKMLEIQERVRPLVEPMAQLSPVVQGMGTIVELGQQVIENMPAIETIERIQANAEIGMLSEAEIRASGFSAQELAAMGPPPAVIDAAAVIRQFDTAIGATLPDQVTLRGFQSSWPAIDAFNHQLAVLEGQGVSYSQIIDNLRRLSKSTRHVVACQKRLQTAPASWIPSPPLSQSSQISMEPTFSTGSRRYWRPLFPLGPMNFSGGHINESVSVP